MRAILSGQRHPVRLAALRDRRIQAPQEEIGNSLRGNCKEDVLFELQQALEAYDFYRQQTAQGDEPLQKYLAALPTREAAPQPPAGSAARTVPAASHARPRATSPALL